MLKSDCKDLMKRTACWAISSGSQAPGSDLHWPRIWNSGWHPCNDRLANGKPDPRCQLHVDAMSRESRPVLAAYM